MSTWTDFRDGVTDFVKDTFSDVGSFIWNGIETGLNFVTGGLYEYAKGQINDYIDSMIPEQEFRDRQRTVRGGAVERTIIYGRARVGGHLVYVEDAGKDNTILWLCYVLAGHECEEIESVYANGVKIASSNGPGQNGTMVQINNSVTGDNAVCWSIHGNRLGAFIPSADFSYSDSSYTRNGANPPNWDGSHQLALQTYVWIALGFDDETFGDVGLPKFTFDVKGKNDIYDPRTFTTKYTDNQALCLLDVLLWDRMFDADLADIDLDAFKVGADVADENVVSTSDGLQTENRYTVNGTAKFNIRPIDLLGSMDRAGAGVTFWLQGKWTYVPGNYQAPVLDFNEDDLVGGLQFSAGPGKQNKHNVASGEFVDADQDFELVGFPELYVSEYVADDGEVLEKTYDFPFTNSGTMARRLAKIDIERTRFGISVNGIFKFRALRLTPGDRINLTISELGWTPKVFRVTSCSPSFDSGVELSLREDAPGVYNWDANDALALESPPILSIPDGLSISAPTDLIFVESLYETIDRQNRAQLEVSWPDQPSAAAYDVQYKLASSGIWIEAGSYWQDNSIVIRDLVDNTYDVRVRAIGALGAKSAWYEESYTITGTVADPVDALSLQELANQPKHPDGVFSTVVVDTVAPADPNYGHSLVEYQVDGAPDWFRLGPTDDNGEARFVVLSDGKTYNVRTFSVSTVGVRSSTTVTASITVSNSIDLDDPEIGGYLPAPSVNGLELTGQGNDTDFTGGDAKFEWRATTVEQWYEIGSEGQLGAASGALDQYFRDYQVEVWADVDGVETIIRTEFVVDPIYVYAFEKNAEDYGRKVGESGAWRTFEVRVYARGRLNQLSAVPAKLQVTNPPPAPLNALSVIAGFNTVSISYKRPVDLDFAGVQIWISQEQGFDPEVIEPTATVSDNSFVAEGLTQGEVYYARLRPFDDFGTEGALISSEIAVTTKTGVDITGLSGWAYEIDPVDRAFVNANMADGAISLADALVGGELPGSKLANLAVSAAKLADSSVDLAGNKITGQLGQVNLADSAVTTSKLASLSITAAKLASSSVTATKIANLAVGTAAIANAAITNAKIGNLAVGTAKIANAAITNAKIANLAVGTAAIQDLAVTDAKIKELTAGKILTGTLAATETITSEGLIRAVDDINTPTVEVGLGPRTFNTTAYLLWAYNGADLVFGVDELGNVEVSGAVTASSFTNDELIIDASGNLTSTGTFEFGGLTDNFVVYDGTRLIIDTDNFSVDASGNASFSGTVTGADVTGSTITGGVVRTDPGSTRVELSDADNALTGYIAGSKIFQLGGAQGTWTTGLNIGYPGGGTNQFGVGIRAYGSDYAVYGTLTDGAGFAGVLGVGKSDQPGVSGSGDFSTGAAFDSSGVYGQGQFAGIEGAAYTSSGSDFYASGPGTNYAPFTGSHDALIARESEGEAGDVYVATGKFWKRGLSQTIPELVISRGGPSKAAYGVFAHKRRLRAKSSGRGTPAALTGYSRAQIRALARKYDRAMVNALGEGQINACAEGGDLEVGDFVCTSATPGKVMRYDGHDMRYVVAKVMEPVEWNQEPNNVKMVACIYLCG